MNKKETNRDALALDVFIGWLCVQQEQKRLLL